jgi:hypothetical protein
LKEIFDTGLETKPPKYMPVRKIGITSRSVPTAFDSIKTGDTHMCESTVEADFCYWLEFDPLVKSYEAQPIKIFFKNAKGRRTRYVPDFNVSYTKDGVREKGRTSTFFEIKERWELDECKDKLAPKFKAAEIYCRENGSHFEIRDDQSIRIPRLNTYKFLYRYLSKESIPKVKVDLMNIAERLETFKVQELIDSINGGDLLKGQSLSNIWHLVATRELHTDWDRPITNASILTTKKA